MKIVTETLSLDELKQIAAGPWGVDEERGC